MGPSLFQTGAEAEESGSFLCGEFVPQSSCSQICQMRFTFLHSVQADVPGLLKVAGNKSVVWIDRFIAATRLIRPEPTSVRIQEYEDGRLRRFLPTDNR